MSHGIIERTQRSVATGGARFSVVVDPAVDVLMRDGVRLEATVYRPSVGGRFPVLLTRTPYGRDLSVNSAYLNPWVMASQGFVVVMQDCRGRFASDGEFVPSVHEAADGEDTLAWAARQPWSSGRIGMWGRSYFAETQWRAASSGSPWLGALALGVSAGGNAGNGALFRGGVFELGSRLGWGQGSVGRSELERLPPDAVSAAMARYDAADRGMADGTLLDTLPVAGMAEQLTSFVAERVLPTAGQRPDGPDCVLWDGATRDPVALPTLHIGGWFDIFLPTTLDTYAAQSRAHAAGEAGPAHLIMGPWSHSNFSGTFPDRYFAGGAGAAVLGGRGDVHSVHAAWFARHLGGEEAGPELPGALVYIQGRDEWVEFDALPEPDELLSLQLGSDGGLALSGDGLGDPAPRAGGVHYVYDPLSPAPTVGGSTMLMAQQPGPADQAKIESRGDVVCFTSDPLSAPLTLFGRVSAHLKVSTSASDTDFVVRLCVVDRDGVSRSVVDGISRASWRHATAGDGRLKEGYQQELVVPDEPFSLDVDLWSTAVTVAAGERIRVQVTSSCHPRWERNLNTGKSAWDTSESVIAHQTVFCGDGGSYLSVGVMH